MQDLFLKVFYRDQVLPELMKSVGYRNRHQVPVIQKVVLNSGVGSQMDKSVLDDTVRDLGLITGQKPIVTKARTSISNFKVREGMPVGVKVTLRGNVMYNFLHRLLNIALPEIRDFRGVSSRFDGHGNFNLGITDHAIFPEISMDGTRRTIGMDVTIVTSAATDEEGLELLKRIGMPFRQR